MYLCKMKHRARITHNNITYSLGTFETKEEAQKKQEQTRREMNYFENYTPKTNQDRQLPKNISYDKTTQRFRVRIKRENLIINTSFKTLEEAIEYKENIENKE